MILTLLALNMVWYDLKWFNGDIWHNESEDSIFFNVSHSPHKKGVKNDEKFGSFDYMTASKLFQMEK